MENLTIQSVANAVILPYRRCSHSTGLGGVIDETGVYVERSYLHGGLFEHGGSYDFDKSTIVKSDDRVVYFGYYLPHWGHFLIDCLGRMWPFAPPGMNSTKITKLPILVTRTKECMIIAMNSSQH